MYDPLQFAIGQLDRLMGFFPRIDSKATALFAFDVALLTLLGLNFPFKNPPVLVICLGLAVLLLSMTSLICLYSAFFPHLKSTATASTLFFGDIANISASTYLQRVTNQTKDDLLADVIGQIHRNSEILSAKFKAVMLATVFTGIAVLPWLGLVLILSVGGTMKWGV